MERLWNHYVMCVYTYMHTQTEVELCPWVQENINLAHMGLWAKTSGALLQLRSEQLNGHLLSPLLLQMKPRWYQCTCMIYLAKLRVFICNTFMSICPRYDLCAVHKVVFKWPYSALSACRIRWYMFLEEINSDYGSTNPNKMICRIKWKECTGKFTLIAGIQGNLLIFRDKSFVVRQIFTAGAEAAGHHFPWNKASSTAGEKWTLNSWRMQAPRISVMLRDTQQLETRPLCMCMYINIHNMHILAWKANVTI